MTAGEFRNLALSLPEASEEAHMGHPDFRIGRKIFATLGPNEEWGMVKLTVEQQAMFIEADPEVFQHVDGAWGRGGCTYVCLAAATEPAVQVLLWNFRNSGAVKLKFKIDTESDNVRERLEAITNAWKMGLKIKADELYSIVGTPKPDPDDEILANPQIAAAASAAANGGVLPGPRGNILLSPEAFHQSFMASMQRQNHPLATAV